MSIIVKDSSLGIEVKSAVVRIAYYTVNRTGYFPETGLPRFSANLYLEYSEKTSGSTYFRKDVSIDNIGLEDLNFGTFYDKMKETEEFKDAKDNFPVYVPDIPAPSEVTEAVAE